MDQDTKKMTRTAIYVAAGGYLLYLAYQLFGRLSESTGLSYTVSLAAMVLFAAGGINSRVRQSRIYQKMFRQKTKIILKNKEYRKASFIYW